MAKKQYKRGPHADLVAAGLDLLKLHGVFCWGNNTGVLKDRNGRPVRYGCVGSSDIIGVLPNGQFIGAEAKVGNDPVRPAQVEWMESVRENAGIAIVFHDLDELETALLEAIE